jgi:hypothetical protein
MSKDQNGKAEEAERRRRLAQALRENLKRRKSQLRGRQAESAPSGPCEAPPERD